MNGCVPSYLQLNILLFLSESRLITSFIMFACCQISLTLWIHIFKKVLSKSKYQFTSNAINAPSSSSWSFFALKSSLSCYETQAIVTSTNCACIWQVLLYSSGIGHTDQWLKKRFDSWVLKVSVVCIKCQLIPTIHPWSKLNQHLINALSILVQHTIGILVDSWSTFDQVPSLRMVLPEPALLTF